jgi:inosose dehydratase
VRGLLALTDPAVVSWIPDTGQLTLGGGDPAALIADHYDRIAAIHWKDTKASYRGYTGPTPSDGDHRRGSLYKDLGTGVDLPRIRQCLRSHGYVGWIALDLDPPRPAEGDGTPAEKLESNRRYLLDTLGVGTLG